MTMLYEHPNHILIKTKRCSIESIIDPVAGKIYHKTNEAIEFWTNVAYIFFIKVVIPTVVIVLLGISYALYFATNMGNNAFIEVEWNLIW